MEDYYNCDLKKLEEDKNFHLYSDNINLTLDFIESHINENWNFFDLTQYSIITKDFILKYKSKPWNFNHYKFLKSLTMEEFLEIEDKIEDFETLSRNYNISLEYILDNSDKSWCWFEISKRPDISHNSHHESKPLNYYLLYKSNNKIYYKADFLASYKQKIIEDFEDYVSQLRCIYEKNREQGEFIKLLLRHM